MATGIEEWLPARDWPLYEVSSLGSIRNVLSKKILKPHTKRYPSVSLCDGRTKTTKNVHRIVANTFIQNPNNLSQVNHKNGIKTDNRVENLEWVSCSENRRHGIKIGLIKKPKYNIINRVLDDVQVKTIKSFNKDEIRNVDIAKYFKIHSSVISRIRSGKSWPHH